MVSGTDAGFVNSAQIPFAPLETRSSQRDCRNDRQSRRFEFKTFSDVFDISGEGYEARSGFRDGDVSRVAGRM